MGPCAILFQHEVLLLLGAAMTALQGSHWDYAHAFGVVYVCQHGVLGACLDGHNDEAVSIVRFN